MVVKIDRHGQASVLTSDEIELLFNDGFLTDRDRTLFGLVFKNNSDANKGKHEIAF